MLSAVTMIRARLGAAVLLTVAACAACSSTTNGSGNGGPTSTGRSTPDFPTGAASAPADTGAAPTGTTSTGAVPTRAASSGAAVHPAPADPLRTATVHAADGVTYVIKIWTDVHNDTCFDHAYGQPMITFLTEHPCQGLERVLGTTTVNGRPVGFAESATSFTGTAKDPYVDSGKFRTLVEKDGTGNINDLLREGYRLPSGPTSVPSPDAFSCVGQDNGVTVWDVWYLDGPTPNNDKPLVTMTTDIFLQF
jgi:hypothetical protein